MLSYSILLVPGAWTVQRGHDLVEDVEAALRHRLPHATVFTHLEPAEVHAPSTTSSSIAGVTPQRRGSIAHRPHPDRVFEFKHTVKHR